MTPTPAADPTDPAEPAGGDAEIILRPLRAQLDALDDQLVDLLADRMAICAKVAGYKRTHGIPMAQSGRVEAVKRRCAARAAARGLDGAFVRDLYDRIIGEACALESRIIGS